jgi:hypothetical protein
LCTGIQKLLMQKFMSPNLAQCLILTTTKEILSFSCDYFKKLWGPLPTVTLTAGPKLTTYYRENSLQKLGTSQKTAQYTITTVYVHESERLNRKVKKRKNCSSCCLSYHIFLLMNISIRTLGVGIEAGAAAHIQNVYARYCILFSYDYLRYFWGLLPNFDCWA